MEDQHQHTKRQRQDGNGTNGISEDQQHQQVPPPPRRLFAPFRALGVVSNGTPHALQLRSSTHLKQPAVTVVTSLGSSWAMWDAAASLNLLFVGPPLPSPITSLLIQGDSVFAASGSTVHRYVRGKEVATLSSADSHPDAHTQIGQTILFNPYLCAISTDGRKLLVWDITTNELTTTIEFDPTFIATRLVHPSTYLNKVVVASREGSLQIWNIQTRSLIHEFTPDAFGPGIRTAAITAIVQSPAIDVLALGFSDGKIVVFDIRLGQILLEFAMSVEGATQEISVQDGQEPGITSLSFRTDNEAQTLASSDASGNIALWDLDSGGKLLSLLRRAHDRRIGAVQFLPGQPVLLSNGADNAIREWIFDTPTSPPRLLKERSGHAAPPSMIRYYGSDGKSLLSSSKDDRTLRYSSVVRDSRSFELSQGSVTSKSNKLGMAARELRLSPVEGLSFTGIGAGQGGVGNASTIKREWDDVLTFHSGEDTARTWSVGNKRLGKHRFAVNDAKIETGPARAACVTACGNFGLVGYERADRALMWNMQSGIRRREFKLPKNVTASKDKRARHVSGIEVDALNTVVVLSTLAGALHFFDFHSGKHISSTSLPNHIVAIVLQRENNLLACVCDDLSVRLVDIETKRTVREFVGFRGRIVDIAFSNDSRWLLTTSTDSIIRTFDIPTGQLVDAFKTSSVATSMTFSPTGDFLATSHVDSVGVFLWTNRAQFTDVSLRTIDEDDILRGQHATLPSLQGSDEASDLPTALAEELAVPQHIPELDSQQLSSSLVTLSLLPRSKWQTLINLETITARNKPREKPKAPEQAPFFLPTLPGTETRFDMAEGRAGDGDGSGAESRKRRVGFGEMEVESDMVQLLRKESAAGSKDYDGLFSRLFALSPSALDLEIRSLAGVDQLELFMQAMTARLRSRRDFEAVQAVMSVFLTIHGDVLSGAGGDDEGEEDGGELFGGDEEDDGEASEGRHRLEAALRSMLDGQLKETRDVGNLVRTSLGLVAWARGVPVV